MPGFEWHTDRQTKSKLLAVQLMTDKCSLVDIVSLLDLAVNLQQNHLSYFPPTFICVATLLCEIQKIKFRKIWTPMTHWQCTADNIHQMNNNWYAVECPKNLSEISCMMGCSCWVRSTSWLSTSVRSLYPSLYQTHRCHLWKWTVIIFEHNFSVGSMFKMW